MACGFIMPQSRLSRKCTNLFFLSLLHRPYGRSDFTEYHFGNITGGGAKNGYCLRRVEVPDASEVLRLKKPVGIAAASNKEYIRHATFKHPSKPDRGVQIIQFFQKTGILDFNKLREVVCVIVLCDKLGHIEQRGFKDIAVTNLTELIFERLHDLCLITRLHLPEADGSAVVAVGIRHIKYMAQLIPTVSVNQKRDALGSFVYPATQLVPYLDFGARRCRWVLRMNEKLVSEVVFIIVRCGNEKRHIALSVRGNSDGFVRCHFYDKLVFARHDLYASLLYFD
ncbi:MAG: hypothetical protein GX847_01090 [Clostridiales bacterium]|nr:hypothetical protein [Clostridiales bacterium]